MAKNLSFEAELKGILQDVARHRFTNNRQINPNSMLYQTVKQAIDDGLIKNGSYHESDKRSLADIMLTNASLSKLGQEKLVELTNTEE